jgi:hypothetical protein
MDREAVEQSSVCKVTVLRVACALPGIASAIVLSLLLNTAADAATILVNSLADPGAPGTCALRDAITAADTMEAVNGCAAGTGHDTIRFLVTGTIQVETTLPQIINSLTMKGPGAPAITIDGANEVQVMRVAPSATLNLKNLIVAHGFTEGPGGGILNNGTLIVTNCTFSSNNSNTMDPAELNGGEGGAIWNGGTLTIANTTFSSNRTFAVSSGQGGAIWNIGTLTVTNSAFSDNDTHGGTCCGYGGAIWNDEC